jgi:DHA2 family methylenomycin A resistance protein-like MFS transporter
VGISQAVLGVALLAVAWAASASPLWPLMLALLPAGFFSGLLVPAMTSQSIAAVEPALHGAASAAFNTARQVGGAIGIAVFGPLLGTAHDLTTGFITCVLVTVAATALALLLTLAVHMLGHRPRRHSPRSAGSRGQDGRNVAPAACKH